MRYDCPNIAAGQHDRSLEAEKHREIATWDLFSHLGLSTVVLVDGQTCAPISP